MGTVPQRDRNASDDDQATGQSRFERFAHRVSEATGHPTAFAIAFGVILVWAISGPLFGFNETWQLVINTGTTIVTFLMVFLIQNTQNRDGRAMQLKLDELIKTSKSARNSLIDLEDMSDEELDGFQKEFARYLERKKKRR